MNIPLSAFIVHDGVYYTSNMILSMYGLATLESNAVIQIRAGEHRSLHHYKQHASKTTAEVRDNGKTYQIICMGN